MSSRQLNILLIAVLTGGLIASGVITVHMQKISTQLHNLEKRLSQVQNTKPPTSTPLMKSSNEQDDGNNFQLLQKDIQAVQVTLKSLKEKIGESHENDPDILSPEQTHKRQQVQKELTQLVTNAVASGEWSNQDAEQFRNQSVNLKPQEMQMLASQVIQAMESGTLHMPADMVTPF